MDLDYKVSLLPLLQVDILYNVNITGKTVNIGNGVIRVGVLIHMNCKSKIGQVE